MKKERIKEILTEIKKVVSDKQRKSIIKILYELFSYFIINKDLPKYYSKHMLHRKDAKNYLDYYIGKKEFYNIRHLVMDGERELITILENKVLFHCHFKKSKLRLPTHLGYNLGKTFFSEEGNRSIHNYDSFSCLMRDLILKTGTSSIFIKPIAGRRGEDCFKIDNDLLNSDRVEEIYNKISSKKYLFQETIIQHPLISGIYPYSVNSLRIHTCIYMDGKIDVISMFMKFGYNRDYVESGSKGTIYISVDMNTGSLGPFARKNFDWGGDIFIHHPDNGVKFSGFIVPHFEAAKDMAKAAAAFLLPYRLVGWDIAITEEGPILLEGNHDFGFWGAQISDGGYKKNKIFKAFYEELVNSSEGSI